MFRILTRQDLAPQIHLFIMDAPAIARKAQPGQFVIIRIDENGERVPLTIADWDREQGTVTLVFMEAGKSTSQLALLQAGGSILDLVGPLGEPSHIDHFGTVVCVSGGFAVAPVWPIARALKDKGNRIISIMGARSKDLIFWEERLRSVSDRLIVTTDDGSYGRKGLVTAPLKELLESERIDRVVAIGPAIMMKFCAETTRPFGVKTIVSLNTIMVDGTGMCGSCRCSVGGATKFACVDGPEFDGHEVDWDLVLARQRVYQAEERNAVEEWRRTTASVQEAKTGG
ncbi:MAG: sulfide/dihydroorotate dehydrogenase-like FAD/NAD-binding protein [Chloroflexi bacterium]|nr:sulfide/dihydroorotate dehydrogenase-like FAD/NAD-binding protein [Chloroflexota bacterium]